MIKHCQFRFKICYEANNIYKYPYNQTTKTQCIHLTNSWRICDCNSFQNLCNYSIVGVGGHYIKTKQVPI